MNEYLVMNRVLDVKVRGASNNLQRVRIDGEAFSRMLLGMLLGTALERQKTRGQETS